MGESVVTTYLTRLTGTKFEIPPFILFEIPPFILQIPRAFSNLHFRRIKWRGIVPYQFQKGECKFSAEARTERRKETEEMSLSSTEKWRW
jgi:hypothetical protein